MTPATETLPFEAEVQRVLDLVIHSLYTNREIFLRELLSNSSDALDKLRFEAVQHPELLASGEELEIRLERDPENRVLVVRDNGIGMDREDLVTNLGRIASSGTRRFLEAAAEAGGERAPDLIGQFGVGFYSCFMVASRVVVETRKAGDASGWRWSSAGDGRYTIEEAPDAARGTRVELTLKPEDELDRDYLSAFTLRSLVKRYSDFIEHPIRMERERDEDEDEDDTEDALETLNSRRPLWVRSKDEIEPSEYHEFYRHLAHDFAEPAKVVHFKAEGALEYTALLFVPGERPHDPFEPAAQRSRIALHVRRVLVMAECEELLPQWLRFVRGVVDALDLPLNVSRETLQENPHVRKIRERLVTKLLQALGDMLEGEREHYEKVWRAHGAVLKEGIAMGDDREHRISKLCLFESSASDVPTTLDEYVQRMPVGQPAIYVLTGSDRRTLSASPLLEAYRSRGYEVLFWIDPIDEWVLDRLHEFEGKPLRAIDTSDDTLTDEAARKELDTRAENEKPFLDALGEALGERVGEVRLTARLTDSPAALVTPSGGVRPHLARMLRAAQQEVPPERRVLELNPAHPLFTRLRELFDAGGSKGRFGDYAELLHGQALLAEGSTLPDPARYAKLVADLMLRKD